MADKRSIALAAALGFAAAIALGAWFAGGRIETPADAAARTAPPAPSPILVPVEQRVLAATIVTRGSARFGLPQKVSLVPSALKAGAGVIGTLPARNTPVDEGSVLLTASGRPVFVLRGDVPAYRDLGPGLEGDDVRQLEQALARSGAHPGPVDGVYDLQTAAAVARWYQSRRWEPFGATREQLAALTALEQEAADAHKARQTATAAVAAAALAVEAARAAADHAVKSATSDLANKRAEARRTGGDTGTPLGVESERAKARHADAAAAVDLATQTYERALIVLDPRQPATARAAAEAKLALARAAAERTRLEGELAIQAAEREARLAADQVTLAESALRSAELEARKNLQSALDAQALAGLEARQSTARADRLGAELDKARRRIGVQVPADEIVFIPSLPVRVEEVSTAVGASASGPLLSVTDNQLSIDSSLPLDAAPLVKPGMPVTIDEQDLGLSGQGVVQQVAGTPGTHGVDGYHFYLEVRVTETRHKLDGFSLRLTIPTESTQGPVLAVPTSALSLAADGRSRVQVQDQGVLKYVVVEPGLSTGGYAEVTPVDGRLEAGQLVVVGYKSADRKETP